MSKHILEILFDSSARLKILKYLFRNIDKTIATRVVAEHVQEDISTVRKELKKLEDIGLLKKDRVNSTFEYLYQLRDLVLKSSPAEQRLLVERINKLGRIKFAAIAGILIDKENSDPLAVDIFLVGDDLDKRRLTNFLKSLEADVGKEIRFATMEREEFKYRFGMFDRFVRVLLESPHEKLINKLGV